MTMNLALAASIVMLVGISGQALAATAPNARYGSAAAGPSDRQQAAYAFDSAMTTQIVEPDAYRYHGGPKYND